MKAKKLNNDQKKLLEISKILNQPGMTWKVRRALLIHKVGLSEDAAKELVPDPEDKDQTK